MKTKQIKSAPYYNVPVRQPERELAAALRREFVPKIARRLPGHHLKGFRHDEIVNFVKKHKKTHPFFLRTDISRFYPSVRHRDLIVGCQIAYRELLGLSYVPRSFKEKYVGALHRWCDSLPTFERGIPIGSPVSAIAAPVMLVPVWLEVKRQFGVPLLVFMDDVLVCCRSKEESSEIFVFMQNLLAEQYALELNPGKTCSGRFATDRVEFCGWSFAGGYALVSENKATGFLDRIENALSANGGMQPGILLKRINRLIDGFGHHYKYGNVSRQYKKLDCALRKKVRKRLAAGSGIYHADNNSLYAAGLHSLSKILNGKRDGAVKRSACFGSQTNGSGAVTKNYIVHDNRDILEDISCKLTQMLAINRKQYNLFCGLSGNNF